MLLAAGKRLAQKYGTADLTLLFADTNMEDADLYRFIEQAAQNIGGKFVRIADGRTPWQVFKDEKFIGNHRADLCSRILKRDLLDKYRNEHFDPADTICYIGVDWSEIHRLKRLQSRAIPWRYEAPLCDDPKITKEQCFRMLEAEGIKRPRLYDLGFPHNNCGGFCVKAGHAHFRHLLKTLPDVYAYHETMEQETRQLIGKDVGILNDRRGGQRIPMTLETFRNRIQADLAAEPPEEEWGGCGCAIE